MKAKRKCDLNSEYFVFRAPPGTRASLVVRAAAQSRSVSSLIREAVRRFLISERVSK